jgi:serine/threonine protein kinase
MDYVVGPTLEQHVREHGALPEPELRRLLLLSLQALAVIHQRGDLHRDIKPSNLIVLPGARPLLIDFGAARAALGAKTQMLTVMLSPGYAPFERRASCSTVLNSKYDGYAATEPFSFNASVRAVRSL